VSNQPRADRPDMPGYGLLDEQAGTGLKPWSYAVERLANARGYWIATSRPDGRPHAMPIWGVWLNDKFMFSTGIQSRKARNIAANPSVVIAVEPADDAIILEGTVESVEDRDVKKKFADAYQAKYSWDMEGFDEPVFAVTPTAAFSFSTNPGEFVGGSTRWRF